MGNLFSGASTEKNAAISNYMHSESETMEDVKCLRDNIEPATEEQFYDTMSDDEDARAKIKEDEMNEFRKQLNIKREQRKEILARHKSDKKELENALNNERQSKLELCESNRLLRELLIKNKIEIPENLRCANQSSYITDTISLMGTEIEKLKSTNNTLRCDLAKSNNALQTAYSELADLSAVNSASIKQVHALKEVISVSKTMISLREQQLNELKDKLAEIEQSLADRETSMLSTDLRQEYERQLQNIRTLRGLYEERARLADVSRQALNRELDEHKVLLEAETKKTKELTTKVNELETKVIVLEETVEDKNYLIKSCQEETRGIKAEMSVVNKLFSQVLLGYKKKQDLDQLVHRLEENHGILTQMAGKENGSEVSSELPKLLLELVSQIDDANSAHETASANGDAKSGDHNTTVQEIVENLPKVWRVLIELLSHQSEPDTKITEKVTTCYKSVETKSGPVLVPSVSQTYIRLKDLILEKLTLIKEVNRMKQLNTHLESRLEEQESRLCLVTNELSKTWNVVGRLRRHHHQLHTHEKILKYELQQKRKLLNEIKEELEYCRGKWEQAREKNSQSEKDWKKLRIEFSNRKLKPDLATINNSAESGYSDEKPSDESSESNDESEYVEPKIKCKKKFKKSIETNVDSSADFNLAAEREDPASDLLDVADLPLDTQEENRECDVSDSCNSESLFKNDKLYEETEDEAADIANDSCLEDNSNTEGSPDTSQACGSNNTKEYNTNDTSKTIIVTDCPAIDPATILENIRKQNERLALKDKRLEKLESSGSHLLKKTQTIAKFSDEINKTLDTILNRPTSSNKCDNVTGTTDEEMLKGPNNLISINSEDCHRKQAYIECLTDVPSSSHCDKDNKGTNCTSNSPTLLPDVESITTENSNTDREVGSTVQSHTFESSESINKTSESLDTKNNITTGGSTVNPENNDEEPENITLGNQCEPSSSREIDHEARFAARDLRLKRLEEQTKSLVNKVNKTATKGVKINYKLEELHNIYGSENSRSGTPSEDTEDISQNDDDVPNE